MKKDVIRSIIYNEKMLFESMTKRTDRRVILNFSDKVVTISYTIATIDINGKLSISNDHSKI